MTSSADAPAGRPARLVGFVREHPFAVALAAITVLAAILRFATIGDQSLDHDETVTAARVIHPSFADTMHVVGNGERSPPLYYALIWLWSRIWGIGPVAVRSLSVIFGTLTVTAAGLAGRELASRRGGLIAACLVAFNPYLIWYSQEARSYALLVVLGAFGLYFLARHLRDSSRRSLAGWAAMSALALCSHYFAIFAIAPEAVLLLAAGRSKGNLRPVLAAIAAVTAVGLALLPLAVSQESGGRTNNFTHVSVAQRAETAFVKYVGSEGPAPQAGILGTTSAERRAALAGAALLLLAAALVLARGSPPERRGALLAFAVGAAAFGVPLVLAWAGFDFVDPRNLIAALVPALVLAGIGFGTIRAPRAGLAGAAGALVVFGFGLHTVATDQRVQRHNWRAVAAVMPHRNPAVYVVPSDARTPLGYYTHRHLANFETRRFPDGVATRRVVVVSDFPTISGPGTGFRLIHSWTAPQHWTVNVYAAARPRPFLPSQLDATKVMTQASKVLVGGGRALVRLEAGVDSGRRAGRASAPKA